MNAQPITTAPPKAKRHRFHPRFRTTTLLWLTVVVSAFFVGQYSTQMIRRVSQMWGLLPRSGVTSKLVNQPDGTLLVIGRSAIPQFSVDSSSSAICDIAQLDGSRFCIKPKSDGQAKVILHLADGNTETVGVVVEQGTIVSTMLMSVSGR